MKKSIRFMFAFAMAVGAGYGASEAQAMSKLRCVDTACVQACQAAGQGNCFTMCAVACE